jgi:hypothetical protein
MLHITLHKIRANASPSLPYKPEYKETPHISSNKIKKVLLTEWSMS